MKKNDITIRSSTAEYLIYIASSGEVGIEIRYENENIWLTQKMLSTLYDVKLSTINEHIKNIFSDNELLEEATIRKFRIVQKEGNRNVEREVIHYNLQMIIAVGFKINNEKAVQFRKWANTIIKEFTIKGYAITGNTAAEIIYNRANSNKEHMGIKTWDAAPNGKIVKSDVIIAKNYLTEDEISSLRRIVSAYLDLAEDRAKRHLPMTMEDWFKRLDEFLKLTDREILQNAGKISHQIAIDKAESEFQKYRITQDKIYLSDFDKYMEQLETIGSSEKN